MFFRLISRLFILIIFNLVWLIATAQVELTVLGIAQDAGLPQLGCTRSCCQAKGKSPSRIPVVSWAVAQADPKQSILIEATPDITFQWQKFIRLNKSSEPGAIFITHAHMGHYSGLMQLGREARNATGISVYGHPTLIDFLRRDQPWKQLVELENIHPIPFLAERPITIGQLTVRALPVPHRDEISATYAYLLSGPSKRVLLLPDIDKWERWAISIDSLIREVDYAFLDATFFDASELPGRKLSEIPHPTVRETMDKARNWPMEQRSKVILIHFNHTNPLLQTDNEAVRLVKQFGFKIAKVGERIIL